MKSLDQYPTPETDRIIKGDDAHWRSKCRNMEQRLSACRETLTRVDNTLMREAQRSMLIHEALTTTAKP